MNDIVEVVQLQIISATSRSKIPIRSAGEQATKCPSIHSSIHEALVCDLQNKGMHN